MSIIDIIFDIPVQLIKLANVLKSFLFEKITIAGIEFSFWGIFAGIGVVFLILYSIIKN